MGVKVCCWCLKTINKVDRFRKMALQAQEYFLNGAMSNYNFQPQNIYKLQIKSNINNYDAIIDYNEPFDILELTNGKTEKTIVDSHEPNNKLIKTESAFDSECYEEEPIEHFEHVQIDVQPSQIIMTGVSNAVSVENQNKLDHLIELNAFWISQRQLLPRPLETDRYQCVLLTDNDIIREKKLKLEKFQPDESKQKCLLCFQVFENDDELSEHMMSHTNSPKTVLCKFCNVWIEDDQTAVMLHYRKHYVRYKCVNCVYMCESIKLIQFHYMKEHKDFKVVKKKEFRCLQCGEVFPTCNRKQYHVDTVHKKIVHQCDECHKIYKSKSKLQIHKEIHKNEYFTCNECGRTIKNRVSFESHKKHHIKEANGEIQSVTCTMCDKTYKNKLTYRMHMERIHQPERKHYKCPNCEKSFLDERTMEEHKRMYHLGGGLACDVCGKLFQSKSNLKKHLETHADKSNRTRDYICDHCGRGFFTKQQMIEHSRCHSDERPLQCKHCYATFKYKAALFQHNRAVHGKYKRNNSKKHDDIPKTKPVELPFYQPGFY